MGGFFFKVLRGTSKLHSPKKRKRTKVRREQPIRSRPAVHLPYFGRSWPHLVGQTACEAEREIERDCPELYCEVVSVNQLLTMCYCSHRVRILVDRYGEVVKIPHVG
ncbi:hypothetical protein SEVIR_5G387500v4 [Setaria viridis]|uniref:Uncharacterized protein n=1 Tax=Setaria viridis TaxID=4556 RepID=A0A4U6USZ9_SETVI|nr:hypothetical protein SEVIR_5G387500v2 [Setaria viridis]